MIDLQVLMDKLGAMTPYEIAAYFQEEGITGLAGMHICPVARYLRGYGYDCCVGRTAYTLRDTVSQYLAREPNDPQPLPLSVRDFIALFDMKKFPSLWADPLGAA